MPSPKRTNFLTERAAAEVQLTVADVNSLLASPNSRIEVQPTEGRGRYRLTPRGVVGTLVLPSCRLVIRPKVPLDSFLHLLDPLAVWSTQRDQVVAEPEGDLLNFLGGQLARLLEERSAAGLRRDYRERAECSPILQGRLDVAAQLRQGAVSRDRLHCVRDEFTADVICNQIARTTGELVLANPLVGSDARASLERALDTYQGVDKIALNESVFAGAVDSRSPGYGPLLELCRFLAEHLQPGVAAGAFPAPAFLVDMERVFERYVADGLRQRFSVARGWTVEAQLARAIAVPDLVIRPDLCLARHGRLRLVADTKWKDLGSSPVNSTDAYQVIAYAIGLGARRAALLYPGDCNRVWTYDIPRARMFLSIQTLRVIGGRDRFRRSMHNLARELRRDAVRPHSTQSTTS